VLLNIPPQWRSQNFFLRVEGSSAKVTLNGIAIPIAVFAQRTLRTDAQMDGPRYCKNCRNICRLSNDAEQLLIPLPQMPIVECLKQLQTSPEQIWIWTQEIVYWKLERSFLLNTNFTAIVQL